MNARDYSQALSADLLKAVTRAVSEAPQAPAGFAVALSGGTDSAMLAVHAAQVANSLGRQAICFHVHHGLQQHADHWQTHVHALARMLGVPCVSRKVQVGHVGRDGVEAAARNARYQAFKEMAQLAGVGHVLLAHHQDDQAETVMLRLLRGAGPAALGAMAPLTLRDGIHYLRPWLDTPRSTIQACARKFAELTGWEAVQDPSNTDDRYTRSAMRTRLVPHLNQRWAGWQSVLARHACQSRDLAALLDQLAEQDYAGLQPATDNRSFSLRAWRELSVERQALAIRYWLALNHLPMPSQARLNDWMRQLRGLHQGGTDRQMQARHAGVLVCCVQGRVLVRDTSVTEAPAESR